MWPSDTLSNGAVSNPITHWGMGFSVARRLNYLPHSHLRNISAATDLILAKHFDVIIFGNVHRGEKGAVCLCAPLERPLSVEGG